MALKETIKKTAATVAYIGAGVLGGVALAPEDNPIQYAKDVEVHTVEDRPAGTDTVWSYDTSIVGKDTTVKKIADKTVPRPVRRDRSVYRSDTTLTISQGDTVYALVYVVDAQGVSSGIVGVCKRVITQPIDTTKEARIYNRLLVHTVGKPKPAEKEIGELEAIP